MSSIFHSRTPAHAWTLRLGLWAACAIAAAPGSTRAHVCMDAPVSRAGANCNAASPQKTGPCGVNRRSELVTEFRPGETITVRLNETIDHPSHYRIAFSLAGDQFDDATRSDEADGDGRYVLLDRIADEPAARQEIEITLPDIACEDCSLQLIQVMYDRLEGDEPPSAGDLYFACADLRLRDDSPGDELPSVGAGPSDTTGDVARAEADELDEDEDAGFNSMSTCTVAQVGRAHPAMLGLAAGYLLSLALWWRRRARGTAARVRTDARR